MLRHEVYKCIVMAVKSGKIKEPFTENDFRKACPGFGEGTYRAFLHKHAVGNGKTTELFERESPGRLRLLRPFKYGFG